VFHALKQAISRLSIGIQETHCEFHCYEVGFFFSSRTLTTTNQNLMACDMKTATALCCNTLLKNENVFRYMHNFCIPVELPEILSRLCTYQWIYDEYAVPGLLRSKPGRMYI